MLRLKFVAKPRYTLRGDFGLPTVDVLVVCTGQDTSMVMDATVAAARLDWPIDKIRVLVVDETASDSLQRAVTYYANNRALHVTYHRRHRTLVENSAISYKSASINFGLSETRAEGRISGEYIVVFDAEVGAIRISYVPVSLDKVCGSPSQRLNFFVKRSRT